MTKSKNFLFEYKYTLIPSLLESLCNENYGPSVIFQPIEIFIIAVQINVLWSRKQEFVLVSSTPKDFQNVYEGEIWRLCNVTFVQRYTYRVLQPIQMNLTLLWVWAEWAVLGRAKTALKFKYDI